MEDKEREKKILIGGILMREQEGKIEEWEKTEMKKEMKRKKRDQGIKGK